MIEKIKGSSFLKNILLLVSGTAVAQLIPIAISPILTRLYLPASFGILMVYVSVLSILGVVATGRYEKAVIIPPQKETARQLVLLTQILIFSFCIILALLNFFFGASILQAIRTDALIPYSWLLIIGIFFLASDQTYYHWANRLSAYKRMSISKVFNNLSSGVSSIIFGIFQMEALGLIYSKLLGICSSFLVNLQTFSFSNFKAIRFQEIKSTALEYFKFPVFLMPSHLMNALSTNGPPIILTMYYSETEVGWFALTQRVIMVPVSIIARSVGDVFRQKATEMYNTKGSYRALYLKTLGGLAAVGLIPFTILILFAPYLFSLIFGAQWEQSGEYAQILAILFIFQFTTSPLTNAFIISGKQQLEFVWQIVFLISSLLPIVIGFYFFDNIQQTLLLFAVCRAASYLLSIFLTLPFTVKKDHVGV